MFKDKDTHTCNYQPKEIRISNKRKITHELKNVSQVGKIDIIICNEIIPDLNVRK